MKSGPDKPGQAGGRVQEGHGHAHHRHENEKGKNRFLSVIVLNLSISILEIIAGVFSGSLALISDAFHNLEDTASVALSFFAWKISFKRPDENRTYGYKRAEVIAAFVNSLFLAAVCAFLIFEAVRRFLEPRAIDGGLMMLMAGAAFLAASLGGKASEEEPEWRIPNPQKPLPVLIMHGLEDQDVPCNGGISRRRGGQRT